MRGQFSQFGSRMLLGRLLDPESFPELAGFFIAMTLRIPTDADSGLTLPEPASDKGYVRAYYPTGSEYWASTGYGTFTNKQSAEFPPAEDIWSGILGYALMTESTGGDLVAFGRSWVPRVPEGVQLFVPPGALQITMRGAAL